MDRTTTPEAEQMHEVAPPIPHSVVAKQAQRPPAASPAPLSAYKGIEPKRLYIPSIDLHADVEPVTVLPQGRMGVPPSSEKVGYLAESVLPGEKGNAVMDGHVDNRTGPAVFFNLKKLKAGDRIYVKNVRGGYISFKVEEVRAYRTAEAPIERIFGPADEPHLNLITCTGKFSRKKREHEERLVVYAKRIRESDDSRTKRP